MTEIEELPYHSGLSGHGAVQAAPECERAESPRGSLVLRHDLQHPLPKEFLFCDLIYAELPWRGANSKAFDERNGTQTNFRAMMATVAMFVESGVPTLLPAGEWHRRFLPRPGLDGPYAINGVACRILGFNRAPWPIPRSDVELLELLPTLQYQRVGDFACGYGRTGRAFAAAGRTFVMSDYDARCVGYVAQHMDSWEAEGG